MATAKRDLTNPRCKDHDTSTYGMTLFPSMRLLGAWTFRRRRSTDGATRARPRSDRVGKHLRYRWSEFLGWVDGLE